MPLSALVSWIALCLAIAVYRKETHVTLAEGFVAAVITALAMTIVWYVLRRGRR